MGIIRRSQSIFNNPSLNGFDSITTGIVVDTNDPMEQGRVKVACKSLGDSLPNEDTFDKSDIPWCNVIDFTGGVTSIGELGPEQEPVDGLITFGEIKQIPENGTAIVACLEGNVNYRVVLGVLHPHLTKNGLPSGRYKIKDDGTLDGPLTIDGEPLEPLYSIIREAFDTTGHEWITRGVVLGPYAISDKLANDIDSSFADQKNITLNILGTSVTIPNGYYRGGSSGWGIVSKGQHFIYMDDRPESSKIIIRTTLGRQVILDDTNERIYISTPYGKNFIEMDDGGNVDIYSETRVSISGTEDINLSSEGNVRIFGQEGVHISSLEDVRLTSARHHIQTEEYVANGITYSSRYDDYTITSEKYGVEASEAAIVANGAFLELSGEAKLISSGITHIDGSLVYIAPPSPPPPPSGVSLNLDAAFAYNVNRSPFNMNSEGRNWSRSSLDPNKTDNDQNMNVVTLTSYNDMEFPYSDNRSNKSDLGNVYKRGTHWKR